MYEFEILYDTHATMQFSENVNSKAFNNIYL
jgi:hypothetical protein